jgi:hypothetical protein
VIIRFLGGHRLHHPCRNHDLLKRFTPFLMAFKDAARFCPSSADTMWGTQLRIVKSNQSHSIRINRWRSSQSFALKKTEISEKLRKFHRQSCRELVVRQHARLEGGHHETHWINLRGSAQLGVCATAINIGKSIAIWERVETIGSKTGMT